MLQEPFILYVILFHVRCADGIMLLPDLVNKDEYYLLSIVSVNR